VSVRSEYTPLGGGLDLASSPMAVKPGRLEQCLNYEEVFGLQGYRAIKGQERFDGRASPSDAEYTILTFDAGDAAIAVGDTVTGASASGRVVSVTLSSGSWVGADAAGVLILTSVTGSWADNDAIQVSAVTKATANGASEGGSAGDASYQTRLTAAREALRTLIQKVPGEGSILGVHIYRSTVYAVRNAVGSLSAVLYKSTASGWSAVQAGLIPGGSWKFKNANFSGASTTLAMFGVDGKNRLLKYDGNTVTIAAPIFGSEGTSTSSVAIGTGAKTFTIAEGSRSWVATDSLTIWDAATAANSMTGTVTSYNSGTNTLVMNIDSVTGSGTKSAWVIGDAAFEDKPFNLTAHKDHLFLAYPLGQLQTSNLGDPMTYTTTASLFGLGDELTGLTSLKGALLGVFCREKIQLLEGSSATDWVMTLHSDGAGAIADTVADNVGNALFLDDKGVLSLQATQAFGDFEPAVLSRDVKTMLDPLISTVVAARMVKATNQYRLYFSDGVVLRFTILTGNPVIQPKDVSVTRQVYPSAPTCVASGVLSDDTEALFFGTAEGYVMQEDKGTSFDGVEIDYYLRLPFNQFKSPSQKKRFHKIEFELDSADALDVNFRQLFDYDDGHYGHSNTQTAETRGTGGQFDVSTFDTFSYDLPIHSRAEINVGGVGRSQALVIFVTSDFVRPFTVQGVTTQFTPLAMQR